MADYHHDHIRNLALFGHAGSGKSALAEAMLFKSGTAQPSGNRKGTSITDFTDQKKQAGHSLETSLRTPQHACSNSKSFGYRSETTGGTEENTAGI